MPKCDVCSKDILFGRKISITRSQVSRRALAKQKPNVHSVRVDVNGTPKTCMSAPGASDPTRSKEPEPRCRQSFVA